MQAVARAHARKHTHTQTHAHTHTHAHAHTHTHTHIHTHTHLSKQRGKVSSIKRAQAADLEGSEVQPASLLAQEEQLQSQLPVKKKRVRKRMTSDMVQWCHGIGFNELCWMCPTESDPSYARLCLVIQVAQGMCFFMKCLLVYVAFF